MTAHAPLVVWFETLGRSDVPLVGGKNASLGEMVRHLTKQGVKVPAGFATTADAYWRFVEANGLRQTIAGLLGDLESGKIALSEAGSAIRRAFLRGTWPPDSLHRSRRRTRSWLAAPARASWMSRCARGTAEDLPDASFRPAGILPQHRRCAALLDARRRCYAALFTRDRAAPSPTGRPRSSKPHLKVEISSERECPEHGALGHRRRRRTFLDRHSRPDTDKAVVINAAWGLARKRRAGAVDPANELSGNLQAASVRSGAGPDHRKDHRRQSDKLHSTPSTGERPTRNVAPTSKAERSGFVLSDSEILTLARWACVIEKSLRLRDGHGVGERRRKRRVVHRAGAAGNGAVAPPSEHAEILPGQIQGPHAGDLAQHRRGASRDRTRLFDRKPARHRSLCRRLDSGHPHDRSGLGADHAARRGHRTPPTAGGPRMPPSSAASSACR